MTFVARGDRVIVKPQTPTRYQQGSVLVTDSYAKDTIGYVVACGETTDVKVDDAVIFPPEAGQVVEYGGERYLVMREDEILGVWD